MCLIRLRRAKRRELHTFAHLVSRTPYGHHLLGWNKKSDKIPKAFVEKKKSMKSTIPNLCCCKKCYKRTAQANSNVCKPTRSLHFGLQPTDEVNTRRSNRDCIFFMQPRSCPSPSSRSRRPCSSTATPFSRAIQTWHILGTTRQCWL